MEKAGVLIYGYNGDDAARIRAFLDEVAGFPVCITSGSGKNRETIADILQNPSENVFADEEAKIMMLLGFPEEQISAILGNFSIGAEGLKRPIFCMLTEQNQNWPLEELLEHLEEERRYWTSHKPA
jgi:hypothetical protein